MYHGARRAVIRGTGSVAVDPAGNTDTGGTTVSHHALAVKAISRVGSSGRSLATELEPRAAAGRPGRLARRILLAVRRSVRRVLGGIRRLISRVTGRRASHRHPSAQTSPGTVPVSPRV
ncbi:MAG: hypothetical protein AAFN30_20690 [Actinomycetota bacterium]